jgi:beta-glucosidase
MPRKKKQGHFGNSFEVNRFIATDNIQRKLIKGGFMRRGSAYFVFVCVLIACSIAFAQSGDFQTKGKVVGADGKGIAMATITYTSIAKRLSFDFSSADGSFGGPVATKQPEIRKTSFSLASKGPVSIGVYDITGKKVAEVIHTNLDQGIYSIESLISQCAQGTYALRIKAGSTITCRKFVNSGTRNFAVGAVQLSSSGSAAMLAKKLAAVDTVRIGKTGYVAAKVAIDAYTADIGSVTLQAFDVEGAVNSLFGKMSADEKIGQLAMPPFFISAGDVSGGRAGSVFGGGGQFANQTPQGLANYYDGVNTAMLATPQKIPILLSYDGVHGMDVMPGGTIFPHNMGFGAIQDSNLIEKAFRVVGIEIRATGANWTFGPCIAVIRDDRWGRAYEGFTESPELTMKMARYSVLGLQTSDLSHPLAILATVKHFAGDGNTGGGANPGQTEGPDATARAINLPGYTSAIQAGAGCVMPSFSSWCNGVPMHQNKALLTDWLKTEQGFSGFVVGDWEAHGGGLGGSMGAGLDVPMAPSAGLGIKGALSGIDAGRTGDACKRVLRVKYRMDLFNNPYAPKGYAALVGCPEHRDVARACVRASLVLLKNEKNTLPVPKTANVCIAGPGSDDVGLQCGGWTTTWQGSAGNPTPGTSIKTGISQICTGTITASGDASNVGNAEYVIVVLAERPYAETAFGGISLTGDGAVAGNAAAINNAKAAKAAGKKLIVVLMAGRPLDISPIINEADAFIWASLPGTEGKGIGEMIFRDKPEYNFTGKLQVTWPTNNSQEPINVGDGKTGLYAFGYGLNY